MFKLQTLKGWSVPASRPAWGPSRLCGRVRNLPSLQGLNLHSEQQTKQQRHEPQSSNNESNKTGTLWTSLFRILKQLFNMHTTFKIDFFIKNKISWVPIKNLSMWIHIQLDIQNNSEEKRKYVKKECNPADISLTQMILLFSPLLL